MRPRSLLSGILSYTPLYRLRGQDPPQAPSARYSYAVWFRHLVTLHEHGVNVPPAVIAEIGPGSTLGAGLCGMLCGADRYHAYDQVRLRSADTDREILEELIRLVRERAPIPDEREFPGVLPRLKSYAFPGHLLPDGLLRRLLSEDRLNSIRRALGAAEDDDGSARDSVLISYGIGGWRNGRVPPGSVDLVFSQAVMEYIGDLRGAYGGFLSILRPGGVLSHQIDFRSHGLAETWDGHWACSDLTWKLIRGRRPAVISRHPHSSHLDALREAGYTVLADITGRADPVVSRSRLSARFRDMTDEDRSIATTHIIATRPRNITGPSPGSAGQLPATPGPAIS